MSDVMAQAIRNAAASSAMEGLSLSKDDINTVSAILDGRITLQEFIDNLKKQYKD